MDDHTYWDNSNDPNNPESNGDNARLVKAYFSSQNMLSGKDRWDTFSKYGLVSGNYDPKHSNMSGIYSQLDANPSSAQSLLQGIGLGTTEQQNAFKGIQTKPASGSSAGMREGEGSPEDIGNALKQNQEAAAKLGITLPGVGGGAATGAPQAPGGAQKLLTYNPAVNPSIVDLLNSVGQSSDMGSRTQLAGQLGIQGYKGTAAQNQDLAKKFTEMYNAKKGSKAPATAAQYMQESQTYNEENKKVSSAADITKAFTESYSSFNPVEKHLFDSFSELLSSTNTKQTLTELYKQEMKDQGVPELQGEIANIKKIIDGSEDDIRNEIQGAGGIVTDSQVMALTAARNKTLMRQGQYLSDMLSSKEDYVDRIVQLTQADRQQVDKDLDTKMGITKMMFDMSQTMDNAAADNYWKIVDNVGMGAFTEIFQGNKKAQAHAERIMGLPPGAFSNPAFLSTGAKGDYQFISGTDNQASGVFDKNTGTFKALGGGGGGGGGASGAGGKMPGALQSALDVILGSGSFTKQQQQNVTKAINSGQDPFSVIKNQAKNIMGQTLATSLSNSEKARSAMGELDAALKNFYAKGGNTNIFTGNYENAVAKLGSVSDEKLREVATEIESALQIYRNAVSGTAYAVQEGVAIAAIFPGINKSQGLNQAIINGRKKAFDNVIDEAYGGVLGYNTWSDLKAMQDTTPSTRQGVLPNGTKVTQYKDGTIKDSTGQRYDQDGTKLLTSFYDLNLK